MAQDAVDAAGNPTGAPANTGAPVCTGAGCGQGVGQGADQGVDQGGPTLEELGAVPDENGNLVLPEDVEDIRQGAAQGASNGSDIAGANLNTGAGSDNGIGVDSTGSDNTSINNSATDTNKADVVGNTGGNTQNKNTGASGVITGDANIGVTQVINDNTATINGTAGLNVLGYDGNYDGDLNLGFGSDTASLTGESGPASIRAINNGTGSDSTNSIDIDTQTKEINEVQNDGLINNILDLAAITGQNEASKNTGDGSIATGDASVAATLVNLLNTTVINGSLWVTVADIFGDLNGNIVLPDLIGLTALLGNNSDLLVNAVNEETGSDSVNTIDIGITDETVTEVNNDAEITTTVDVEAITGQNNALARSEERRVGKECRSRGSAYH